MKDRQEPNVPLRWVFRALFALLAVYAVMAWFRPMLGVEVQLAANVPGSDVEVLGIGRHSASVIVVQCVLLLSCAAFPSSREGGLHEVGKRGRAS